MKSFVGAHILSVDQFTREDLEKLFAFAGRMEAYASRQKVTRVLSGAVLGNLFFEPSTRSRISFGAAFSRLGGSVCDTTGFQFSSMAKGESIKDTSRVISGYVDVIVVRHPIEGAVAEFAQASTVPVISGGDGPGEHPTQALLDLYTIVKETGTTLHKLADLKVTMLGDLRFGRTVHSLAKLLSLFPSIEITFVAPYELQMPEAILRRIQDRGVRIRTTTTLTDGIRDADVIYATRLQQERFTTPEEANKYQGVYRLNKKVIDQFCKPSVVLMHPLPRDSRPEANELDVDLDNNSNLAIFRQTDNGIPVRMALFAAVLDVVDQVETTSSNASWSSKTQTSESLRK